jgi:LacI family transcriptional regulator
MREIAALAGVSRTAVSAVLNDKCGTIRLAKTTRQKIESVLRETNFRASAVGRGLALGRSLLIGMLIQDVEYSVIPQVVQGVEDAAEARNYGLLLMSHHGRPQREREVLEFMRARRIDGVLLGAARKEVTSGLQFLQEHRIPAVFLFQRNLPTTPRARFVCSDGSLVGYLAVRHLLEKGHRHVAVVGADEWVFEGVRRAEKECPDPKRIERWTESLDSSTCPAILDHWLGADPRPTAMFIRSDAHACHLMNLAVRKGIRIPQDLALIGVDNIPMGEQAVVPLTTIGHSPYLQGRHACEILFDLIQGGQGRDIIFPPELIVREST